MTIIAYNRFNSEMETFFYQNNPLKFIRKTFINGFDGTSALNPGAGFLRIFPVAFDRLG